MSGLGLVDYGAGNLSSIEQILEYIGAESVRVENPEQIKSCDRLLLPGVGAAGQALQCMRSAGIDEALTEAVINRGVPFLGICLGMQLLADRLHEFGEHQGLGWIPGEVIHLSDLLPQASHVPHTGWSQVRETSHSTVISQGLKQRDEFYFAHSYTFRPKQEKDVVAVVDYHIPLVAAVGRSNVVATQFHPEKSQISGQRLIEAFLAWCP